LLAVVIPEQPGSFLHSAKCSACASVTEFNYRYESPSAAQIFVGFGLSQGHDEKDAVVRGLRRAGFTSPT